MATSKDHQHVAPEYYLAKLAAPIRDTLSSEQLAAFREILHEAIPKPAPKIVDLRFSIDIIAARYYFVLLVGRDRRKKPRRYDLNPIAKMGNFVAVSIILLGLNLTLSASMLLIGYLVKSIVGINLLSGHFPDTVKHLLGLS
jgi:hypothetical protein